MNPSFKHCLNLSDTKPEKNIWSTQLSPLKPAVLTIAGGWQEGGFVYMVLLLYDKWASTAWCDQKGHKCYYLCKYKPKHLHSWTKWTWRKKQNKTSSRWLSWLVFIWGIFPRHSAEQLHWKTPVVLWINEGKQWIAMSKPIRNTSNQVITIYVSSYVTKCNMAIMYWLCW